MTVFIQLYLIIFVIGTLLWLSPAFHTGMSSATATYSWQALVRVSVNIRQHGQFGTFHYDGGN